MRHSLLAVFLAVLLVSLGLPSRAGEPTNPPAPEFSDALPWLNVSRPLSMKALRGKVVLLDFWTYGCVNCMHVIPDLKKLETKYGNKLVVVGIHSPKFDNERNIATLRSIVVRYDLEHPIVNDIDFTLWKQYGVQAWPTMALIDPLGGVVGTISGEGHYRLLDKAIGELTIKFAGHLNERPLPIALERSKIGQSLLAAPGKIAVGAKLVAISDTLHHRVLLTDPSGKIVQIFGDGHSGFHDGPGGQARFAAPQGVSFGNGGIYVADTGNHAVRFIDIARKSVNTVAGNGQMAYLDKADYQATKVGLTSPWDVLFADGQVYIAMGGNHQIWRLDTQMGRLFRYAGSGREDLEDGTLGSAAFAQPSGLAIFNGMLYVADAETSAVRRIDLGAARVDTLIGSGLFDFGDRDGDLRHARLQHVLGVAVRDAKHILIADTYNHKLKLLDLSSRTLSTLAGSGKPGTGGDLNEPGGLALLGDTVLIADTNNNRIVQYDFRKKKLTDWPVRE